MTAAKKPPPLVDPGTTFTVASVRQRIGYAGRLTYTIELVGGGGELDGVHVWANAPADRAFDTEQSRSAEAWFAKVAAKPC